MLSVFQRFWQKWIEHGFIFTSRNDPAVHTELLQQPAKSKSRRHHANRSHDRCGSRMNGIGGSGNVIGATGSDITNDRMHGLKGIVKLHKDRGSKTSKLSGRWSKGAHAYALSPEHADTLIKCVKDTEVKPVDKIIASKFVDWYHLDKNLVQQMPLGLSTTALTIQACELIEHFYA